MTIEEIQIGKSFRDVRVLSILFRSKYRVRIRGRDWHTRQWNRVGDKWRGTKEERRVGLTKALLLSLYLRLEVRKGLFELTAKTFMKTHTL